MNGGLSPLQVFVLPQMRPTQAATVILLWKVVDLHAPTPPRFQFGEYFLSLQPCNEPALCCASAVMNSEVKMLLLQSESGLLHTSWVTHASLFKLTSFGLQPAATYSQLDSECCFSVCRCMQMKMNRILNQSCCHEKHSLYPKLSSEIFPFLHHNLPLDCPRWKLPSTYEGGRNRNEL